MLYQVIEDGEITQSYAMPDHDDTHHLITGGQRQNFTFTTTNLTLDSTHHTILVDANGGNKIITLPTGASQANRIYNIKKFDSSANTVTIQAAGAETIDGSNTLVISSQYDSYTIQASGGVGWWII